MNEDLGVVNQTAMKVEDLGVVNQPDAPNKPSRTSSAFSIFLEEYKQKNPDEKYFECGRDGGSIWKNMSDIEKAPYLEKENKKKAEYEESYQIYKSKKPKKVTIQPEPQQEAATLPQQVTTQAGDTHTMKKVKIEVDGAEKKLGKPPRKPDGEPGSSAFYYFLKKFKADNVKNDGQSEIAGLADKEWDRMTDDEKAVFFATAQEKDDEFEKYTKDKEAYEKRLAELPKRKSSRNK